MERRNNSTNCEEGGASGEGGVKNYKGVTLMVTLYKVYMMVLAERLRKEMERKVVIPPNQVGFQKRLGMMDNISVINYLINRQVKKKGKEREEGKRGERKGKGGGEEREGKLMALFVDLKAAFDT